MDRPHVTLHYERTFPYPLEKAYAWLTDYQDDDPKRAGSIIQRRDVIKRTPTEVEVDGELEVMGKTTRGRALIRLFPEEKRWIAIIGRGGWEFHYKLEPAGPNASRLLIDYNMASRRWTRRLLMRLAKPIAMRRIDKMWDGFDAAMRRELG